MIKIERRLSIDKFHKPAHDASITDLQLQSFNYSKQYPRTCTIQDRKRLLKFIFTQKE